MTPYSSYGNIAGYDIGDDYIKVYFNSGQDYTYSYQSAGKDNVDEMKSLAQSGNGLNGFINSVVKYNYE